MINTVPPDRIVYLLQEDERMFYPHGDDHLACSETLAERFGLVVVNTQLLLQHLTSGDNIIPGLQARSIAFEPAFHYPHAKKYRQADESKKKLFFYARPNNHRNLYITGIHLLDQAALQGVLDPSRWEIHLVGKGPQKLHFSSGLSCFYHDPMPWAEYVSFLQGMNAGLSLMYTPHPSYPPLDLAAMGIPVLTNSFGIKTDLRSYSENILTTGLALPELLDGLTRLMALAEDSDQVLRNFESDHICRDWRSTLQPVVSRLAQFSGT